MFAVLGHIHPPDVVHAALVLKGGERPALDQNLDHRGARQAKVPPHLKSHASALVAQIEKNPIPLSFLHG
ncbi:hypothetical protein GGQ74_002619 [Desulfobaculum xiamenense]|uniref:Uncharacterized protein n=1 Tax=Desulfobaculum xiamenense TaxID=995050 RepID=A0A846QTW8_9BACT|nr:hypothetical protein [Desulfobaculum xiamenense]NJB68925.1 hypothetical protein [Desulfobaculum xiamenense]